VDILARSLEHKVNFGPADFLGDFLLGDGDGDRWGSSFTLAAFRFFGVEGAGASFISKCSSFIKTLASDSPFIPLSNPFEYNCRGFVTILDDRRGVLMT
jgi:hypothetical protein